MCKLPLLTLSSGARIFSVHILLHIFLSMTGVTTLREEVRLLKASAVTDVEKVTSLEVKLGDFDWAPVQTKDVNDELETRLSAAGSPLLGSRSAFRNMIDAAQL